MADIDTTGSVFALFDLDGTLCNARYLASDLIGYQFKKPARIPNAIIYAIKQAVRLLLWKTGFWTYARTVQGSASEIARLLKGLNKNEVSILFSKSAKKTVNSAREDIINLLIWHKEEGHTIIVMSGGFQPFLEEVAKLLGVNHIIGTAIEEVDGYYTGRLIGPLCHGEDRVHLVRSFIEESGFDVNLSSSYAYGDRAQDIPILEMVGHPVAVYPDKALLTYATERGWTVIGA